MHTTTEYLPCPVAFERETGQRLHTSTFHRYRLRGLRGIRLRTWLIGGRRMTTRAAVRRFLDDVSDADAGNATGIAATGRLDTAAQHRAEQAMAMLAKDGM